VDSFTNLVSLSYWEKGTCFTLGVVLTLHYHEPIRIFIRANGDMIDISVPSELEGKVHMETISTCARGKETLKFLLSVLLSFALKQKIVAFLISL